MKWIEDRSENDRRHHPRPRPAADVRGRGRRDGRILALQFNAVQNNGAYLQLLTPSISHLTLFMVPGAYDIPHVSITIDQAFTNTTPTDAYRGAGRPEATHGLERLMDAIADELGLDPAEVRRLNFINGVPVHHRRRPVVRLRQLREALDRALELSDYAGFEARRDEARRRAAPTAASASRPTSRSAASRRRPSRRRSASAPAAGSRSTVRMHPTGKVDGHHRLVAARPGPRHVVVADRRDASSACRSTDVEVIHGDTALAPYGLGTYGSRSLAVGGTALHRSIEKVQGEGAPDRGAPARVLGRRPRVGRRPLEVKGSPERAQDDPGARPSRLGGGIAARRASSRAWRRRRSTTRRTSRSRSARTSARSRSTPRRARSRSSATSRSTTAATSSTR